MRIKILTQDLESLKAISKDKLAVGAKVILPGGIELVIDRITTILGDEDENLLEASLQKGISPQVLIDFLIVLKIDFEILDKDDECLILKTTS